MKRKRVAALYIVLCASLFALFPCPGPAVDTGSISGRVTMPGGSGAFPVLIEVMDTSFTWITDAWTDSDGYYTADGIPTGSYKVSFWTGDDEYVKEWYDDELTYNSANIVTVNAPADTPGIDAELALAGSISGRVTSSGGDGLHDVRIIVRGTVNGWSSSARSDADGYYSVGGIPTGSYKVEFVGSEQGYREEWYDDKVDSDGADIVPVTAPDDTGNIDAQLAPGGSISGQVTTPGGDGIADLWVEAYDSAYDLLSTAQTDAGGYYTVGGLPTGSCKVYFDGSDLGYIAEWYDNKEDFDRADAVSVTAPDDTGGINAQLNTGGSISGRITVEKGIGLPDVQVQLYDSSRTWISSDRTDTGGNYTLDSLPSGGYKVLFWASGLGYINEWYGDKGDFDTADTVKVTAPGDTGGINAFLDHGGSISGRVTAPDGSGISHVWVDAFRLDSIYNWLSWTKTDSDGYYTLTGLPTGSHKVAFWGDSEGYANEWYSNKSSFSTADLVSASVLIDTPGIDAELAPYLWRLADELGDGWYWLDWFGTFNLTFAPWIFHLEHGFLYPFGTSTESAVFWDSGMNAFWWTSDVQYPYAYRFSDGEWLWYLEGSSGPRWFVRLSDGAWESW